MIVQFDHNWAGVAALLREGVAAKLHQFQNPKAAQRHTQPFVSSLHLLLAISQVRRFRYSAKTYLRCAKRSEILCHPGIKNH